MTTPEPTPLTRGAPQWLEGIESSRAKSSDATALTPWPSFLAGQAEKPVRVLLMDEDNHAARDHP